MTRVHNERNEQGETNSHEKDAADDKAGQRQKPGSAMTRPKGGVLMAGAPDPETRGGGLDGF